MSEAAAACVDLPKSAAYINSSRGALTELTGISVLAGDLILVFALDDDTTHPVLPSNWVFLQDVYRSTTLAGVLAYRRALVDNEFTTTGVWTDAIRTSFVQYRPTNCVLGVRGTPTEGNGTGTAVVLPSLVTPLASSWGVNFVFSANSVSYDSGVTATVRQGPAGANRIGILDSNGPCGGSYPVQNITASATTNGWMAITAELELT